MVEEKELINRFEESYKRHRKEVLAFLSDLRILKNIYVLSLDNKEFSFFAYFFKPVTYNSEKFIRYFIKRVMSASFEYI